MASGIRLTAEEMKHIALFESITGATAKDCILEKDRAILVVKEGEIGMAIGRKGKNIKLLEKLTGKKHEIIEYSDDPRTFIVNAFKPAKVLNVRITERHDGKLIAVVSVDPKDKGIAIGKNGKNAERVRMLAKRYFQIENVTIV
ncbi:NusA-like transcription termination signal-binding factor [Candidatus Bathyarchaeota archaeon]|nr:MAG: NusA-like transcription termination signal-binding factor [Candidatus Bathyarchaeota archaeon]